jgi:DMSO/TMAO reductase YedYZ molybdopterin-dependent catalytic subunit
VAPIVISSDAFYRIDTELIVPEVDVSSWQLMVTGMVDKPLTFTYADLLARPLFEQYVTLACVSNPVGGDLVGNALWTGVHLKEILAEAGVQSGATQIVGRSVDGFTAGFPTAWALDPSREPMIAVGMNRAVPAGRAWLSGPADRARTLRLRVRNQVAFGDRANHPRGVRRVLGSP